MPFEQQNENATTKAFGVGREGEDVTADREREDGNVGGVENAKFEWA